MTREHPYLPRIKLSREEQDRRNALMKMRRRRERDAEAMQTPEGRAKYLAKLAKDRDVRNANAKATVRAYFKVCLMCGNCERRQVKECQRCESRMFRDPTTDETLRLQDKFPKQTYKARNDNGQDKAKRQRHEHRSYRFADARGQSHHGNSPG